MGYLIQKTYEEVKEATQFAGSIYIEPMPLVKADRVLIKQVWQNLLSNAIKFSAGEAKPHLVVRVESTDSGYIFWLQDNGIGIPSAEYHKVFEPFHHSDHGYSLEGYGLGLAIVKRIVEKHGGDVWVEPLPKGIQFGFSLPASRVHENKSFLPK
jgi:signal transduction histidine kinase